MIKWVPSPMAGAKASEAVVAPHPVTRQLPFELIWEPAEILAFGLWFCLLGGVAFYFRLYAMGLTELVPRLRLAVTRLTE